MLIFGITGSFGTGKSTVAGMFRQLRCPVIDVDGIVADLIKPRGRCFRRSINLFGRRIVQNGRIDRKKLGSIVFQDKRKLQKLEAIIHPEAFRQVKTLVAQFRRNRKVKAVGVDTPLLFEAGWQSWVGAVIVVKASKAQQIRRVSKRTSLTRGEILERIRAQIPLKDKIRRADYVIDNRSSLTQTRKQVKNIWKIIQCQTIK